MEGLQDTFLVYTSGQPEMDGRSYVKLFRELKLLDSKLTVTDCDLTFAKVKQRGAKKIDFSAFTRSLDTIAPKKKMTVQELMTAIVNTEASLSSAKATQSQQQQEVALTGPEKFFYDKNAYTGVAKVGGPSTRNDAGGYQGLAHLTDRGHVQDDMLHRKNGTAPMGQGVGVDVAATPQRNTNNNAGDHTASASAAKASTASAGGQQEQQPQKRELRGPERFFYDKDAYTGAHKQGGPTTRDYAGGYHDLANVTNRNYIQNDMLQRKKAGK